VARAYLRRSGLRLSDPMSGYFAGRTAKILRVAEANENYFEPRGYKVLFDLLRAAGCELAVSEVFYHFGVRRGGHSKLRARHALCFIRSLAGLSGRTPEAALEAELPTQIID
jgi:hypothetical protein